MLVSSLFCHLGVLANGLLAACEDALCARQTFYQIFSFDPLPYGLDSIAASLFVLNLLS